MWALKVAAALSTAGLAEQAPDNYRAAFKEFVAKYQKTYGGPEEETSHFDAFIANYKFVMAENAKQHSYNLSINEFADQAPREFQSTRLGLSLPTPGKLKASAMYLGSDEYTGAPLANEVDWTTKGAVTPVKNQAKCGSCWSFSSTGALEGAWQIATGQLISLSEQQLVDCDKQSAGCNGGSMDSAFQFLEKQSVCTEASYPYKAKDGTCAEEVCTVGIPRGSVVGFRDVPQNSEKALMEAVSQQPVSVAIEADEMAFQLYSSGVLSKKCDAKLDHGVLAVGYGTDAVSGLPYWKVKNSWGPSWGENGYVRLERGVKGPGECGINSQAVYPVVKKISEAGPIANRSETIVV